MTELSKTEGGRDKFILELLSEIDRINAIEEKTKRCLITLQGKATKGFLDNVLMHENLHVLVFAHGLKKLGEKRVVLFGPGESDSKGVHVEGEWAVVNPELYGGARFHFTTCAHLEIGHEADVKEEMGPALERLNELCEARCPQIMGAEPPPG